MNSILPLIFATLIVQGHSVPVKRASFIIYDMAAIKAADVPPVDLDKIPIPDLLTSVEDGIVFDINGDGVSE